MDAAISKKKRAMKKKEDIVPLTIPEKSGGHMLSCEDGMSPTIQKFSVPKKK